MDLGRATNGGPVGKVKILPTQYNQRCSHEPPAPRKKGRGIALPHEHRQEYDVLRGGFGGWADQVQQRGDFWRVGARSSVQVRAQEVHTKNDVKRQVEEGEQRYHSRCNTPTCRWFTLRRGVPTYEGLDMRRMLEEET